MPHSTFITERIKITSKTQSLKLRPTSKDELKAIIEKEIKEQGPDADLNFIDTSEITSMSLLFEGLPIINIHIDRWDTSNVTNMFGMFAKCSDFTGRSVASDDMLQGWNTSRVKDMSLMFNECTNFNCDLSGWNTSKVTEMTIMFHKCKVFESDLSDWDVSNVIDMGGMFMSCDNFKSDLSSWDVSKVLHRADVFKDCPNMQNNPQLQPKFN